MLNFITQSCQKSGDPCNQFSNAVGPISEFSDNFSNSNSKSTWGQSEVIGQNTQNLHLKWPSGNPDLLHRVSHSQELSRLKTQIDVAENEIIRLEFSLQKEQVSNNYRFKTYFSLMFNVLPKMMLASKHI